MPEEIVKDHVNIGVSWNHLRQMDSALANYYKVLPLAEALDNKRFLGVLYQNIAIVNGQLGDVRGAIRSANQAREIFSALGLQDELAFVCATLSTAYQLAGVPDSSRMAMEEELRIREEQGDSLMILRVLVDFASAEIDQGHDERALEKIAPLLKRLKGVEYRSYYINALFVKVVALSNLGRHDELFPILDSIVPRALKSGDLIAVQDAFEQRYISWQEKGNYRKAFQNLVQYHAYRDSIVGQEVQVNAENLEQKYQNERLQRQLDAQAAVLTIERYEKEAKQGELDRLYLILVAGGILLALGITLVWLWMRQMKLRSQYEKVELEQKALKAQMNPHFLFNALNSIQSCILHEDKQVAYNYHSKFAGLMRQVLTQSEQEVISLQTELETLDLYLSLEQLRSSDHFQYAIEVPEGIRSEEVHVPSMLIQPFVENAIWHGLMNKPTPGILRVHIQDESQYLRVLVDDDGVGRTKAEEIRA
ncbi:MAG: histidine kinase, partial [Bacteroidota bacterium]